MSLNKGLREVLLVLRTMKKKESAMDKWTRLVGGMLRTMVV